MRKALGAVRRSNRTAQDLRQIRVVMMSSSTILRAGEPLGGDSRDGCLLPTGEGDVHRAAKDDRNALCHEILDDNLAGALHAGEYCIEAIVAITADTGRPSASSVP
jgi:hypothetical protein